MYRGRTDNFERFQTISGQKGAKTFRFEHVSQRFAERYVIIGNQESWSGNAEDKA